MKEKDFDEIGKRLYDHEADPPKKGWDKIATILNAPPKSGKVVWLRKNWWKPLVLIVPLTFYTLYSVQKGDDLKSDLFSPVDSVVQESLQPKTAIQPNDETIDRPDPALGSRPNADEQNEQNRKPAPENKKADAKNAHKESSRREGPESSHTIGRKDNSEERKDFQSNTQAISEDGNDKEASHAEQLNDNSINKNSALVAITDAKDRQLEKDDNESNTSGRQTVILPDDQNITAKPNGSIVQMENHTTQSGTPGEAQVVIQKKDSVSAEIITLTDGDIEKEHSEDAQRDKKSRQWRMVASFTPLYLTSKTEPVYDDDVLITKVKNSSPQRIGFDVSLGAGRSVAPNLYVDGLLSFMQMEQTTFYTYSTGEVDTLIATQLPDQSVQVSPVYRVNNAEVLSKYSYGGLKLGATYYFWDNKRRRFNMAAALGAYYLIESDIKEKVNNRWITLDNKGLAKMNYSFTIGAGYNRYLYPGWELMINPVLTRYTGKSQFEQLPYRQTQRSLGVNFMLSKTLEKKN